MLFEPKTRKIEKRITLLPLNYTRLPKSYHKMRNLRKILFIQKNHTIKRN